jgi:anti-sigma regulatory factor (Ser/Thr protein kinase)
MDTRTQLRSRHIELVVDTQAAWMARRFVKATLDDWRCYALVDELNLAVSELVTNAVIHARSDIGLTLVDQGDCVQVRVRDRVNSPPRKRFPGADDTGGRGILLIERIADHWGIEPEPPGKVVWLDLTKHD